MPYLIDTEEIAIEQGRQEGRIVAQQQDIIEALEIRFERVPEGLQEEIRRIADPLRLRDLLRSAKERCVLIPVLEQNPLDWESMPVEV